MNAPHRPSLVALACIALAAGCAGTTEVTPQPATSSGTTATTDAATPPSSTTPASATTAPPTSISTTTTTTSTTPTRAPRPAPSNPPAPDPRPPEGPSHRGRATHYDLTGSGNCMFPGYPGPDTLFVALNAADYGTADLCGAHLAVQGNRGSVTVKVIDQCPECPPGALDLSPQAFARITGDAGVTDVLWQVVSGPAWPAVSLRMKEGSSQWWVGILAVDHRNPVRSLEAQVGGRWMALERQEYNYFLAPHGLGPGPFTVRLTDVYGEQLVAGGIGPLPGRSFPTGLQFAAR